MKLDRRERWRAPRGLQRVGASALFTRCAFIATLPPPPRRSNTRKHAVSEAGVEGAHFREMLLFSQDARHLNSALSLKLAP